MTFGRLRYGVLVCFVAGCSGSAPPGGSDAATTADASEDAGLRADGGLSGCDTDEDGHDGVACGGDDCDDGDPSRHPGAPEVCDPSGRDEDCNPSTYGSTDADGDDHVSDACCNGTTCGDDCDDALAAVHAGLPEVCNMRDDDCDTTIDEEATPVPWYRDMDGDDFGNPAGGQVSSCAPVVGYSLLETDCDDGNASVNPGTAEVCNTIDDNCNGSIDESGGATYFADCDGDTYGSTTQSMYSCVTPPGAPPGCPGRAWTTSGGDCDDTSAATHPGATESCDGIDNECDGTIDGAPATSWCTRAEIVGECRSARCELLGAVEVSAGLHSTCARLASGRVLCWGSNARGLLGNGGAATSPVPDLVQSVTTAAAISTGSAHACAMLADASVACWGDDASSQLGAGWASPIAGYSAAPLGVATGPMGVDRLAGATSISARSAARSCAVAGTRVSCWGRGFGNVATEIAGLTDVVEVAVAANHTCARHSTGTVDCWGANESGQLGDGTTTNRTSPRRVVGLSDAVEISAGEWSTCARRMNGTVVCWGDASVGGVGDGGSGYATCQQVAGSLTIQYACAPTPRAVSGISDAVQVSVGSGFACARRATGAVACWGVNQQGQLGATTTDTCRVDLSSYPCARTPITLGLADVAEISAGYAHACARQTDGSLRCWGLNSDGQLGDGTTMRRDVPASVVTR